MSEHGGHGGHDSGGPAGGGVSGDPGGHHWPGGHPGHPGSHPGEPGGHDHPGHGHHGHPGSHASQPGPPGRLDDQWLPYEGIYRPPAGGTQAPGRPVPSRLQYATGRFVRLIRKMFRIA